jgi:hypothetical protein
MQAGVDKWGRSSPKSRSRPQPQSPREVGTILLGTMAFCRCCASVARWRNERLRTIFFCSAEVSLPIEPAPRIAMPPPGKVEVLLFWALGIAVMILSGAVAIYASHPPLGRALGAGSRGRRREQRVQSEQPAPMPGTMSTAVRARGVNGAWRPSCEAPRTRRARHP